MKVLITLPEAVASTATSRRDGATQELTKRIAAALAAVGLHPTEIEVRETETGPSMPEITSPALRRRDGSIQLLDENTLEKLQTALEASGATTECENESVEGLWQLEQNGRQLRIVLYADGGDAYEPGAAYLCQELHENTVSGAWVHIPPTRELQRGLLFGGLDSTAYLASVVVTPVAWMLLEEAMRGPRRMKPHSEFDDE